VRVEKLDSSGAVVDFVVKNSGEAITIQNPADGDVFRIYGQDVTMDDIGFISIEHTAPTIPLTKVKILIAPNSVTSVSSGTRFPIACRDWYGIDSGDYLVTTQARIGRDIVPVPGSGGTLARVASNIWPRLDVDGNMSATFISGTRLNNDPISPPSLLNQHFSLVAGGSISGVISIAETHADLIEAQNGNLAATIRSWNTAIDIIKASNGTISGTINKPETFSPSLSFVPSYKIGAISAKNITAEIHASGEHNALGSASPYADPDYFAIDSITATEDIGTTATATVVRTRTVARDEPTLNASFGGTGAIGQIIGRSVHIDVETPFDTATPHIPSQLRGDIATLKATGTTAGTGYLKGRVKTFSVGSTITNPSNAVEVRGDLLGTIELVGTAKQPIHVYGAAPAGSLIDITDQDQTVNGCVEIEGSLAGTLRIGGTALTLVQVNGDVSGSIIIGKDVAGIWNGSNYRGRIRVPTGSLLSTGLIEVGGDIQNIQSTTENPVEVEIGNKLQGKLIVGGGLKGQAGAYGSADIFIGGPGLTNGGLTGQVILNAKGEPGAPSSFWNQWTTVTVGGYATNPISLTPQVTYTKAALELGGGSIGVAGFNMHYESCMPARNRSASRAEVNSNLFDLGGIRLRWYGPVTNVSNSTLSILLLGYDGHPLPTPVDMSSCFNITQDGIRGARIIPINSRAGAMMSGGLYRITPLDGLICNPAYLRSDDAVPVSGETYDFYVFYDCNGNGVHDPDEMSAGTLCDANGNGVPDVCEGGTNTTPCNGVTCPADFDHSGQLAIADIFAFLNAWFAGCTAPQTPIGTPCLGSADFDNNGCLAIADIFAFLNAWFLGC
jgi:hypothetical protein